MVKEKEKQAGAELGQAQRSLGIQFDQTPLDWDLVQKC